MEDLRDHIDSTSSMKSIIFVDNIIYNRHTCMDVLADDITIEQGEDKFEKVDTDVIDDCDEIEIDSNNIGLLDERQTFVINGDVEHGKNPCDFLSDTLLIGDNREIILDMLYRFMEDKRVMKKFTKKVISSIMEGLSANKWNINVCNFFHYLLDIDFIYRKRLIGSSEVGAYRC